MRPVALVTGASRRLGRALAEGAARAGHDVAVAVQEYASVAYGWALNDEGHCVKLVADRATKHLLGAHIIGPQASALVQPIIQAMAFGLPAHEMARGQYWIHPALTEVVENALLSLGLKCGTEIEICAEGGDEAAAVRAVTDFIAGIRE